MQYDVCAYVITEKIVSKKVYVFRGSFMKKIVFLKKYLLSIGKQFQNIERNVWYKVFFLPKFTTFRHFLPISGLYKINTKMSEPKSTVNMYDLDHA